MENHFDFAQAVGDVVRRRLAGNNFHVVGAVLTHVKNVVEIIIVVRHRPAAESEVEIFLLPDARLALQSAQREFVMAFVSAGGRIESAGKITIADTVRRREGRARGEPVHAQSLDRRPVNAVGCEEVGNAVAIRVVVARV